MIDFVLNLIPKRSCWPPHAPITEETGINPEQKPNPSKALEISSQNETVILCRQACGGGKLAG
jgi:hypothetical protein